jgi:metallophosphoesterase (TIGR00282 family)
MFSMNILFLGDIVAESGMRAVTSSLSELKAQYQIDFTIANAENAAGGKGITAGIYHELIQAGVDAVTLGNHAFARREILNEIRNLDYLVRPENMEPFNKGHSCIIRTCRGKQIAVMNLIGSAFMRACAGDPYLSAERMLQKVHADIIIIDFHAEATSEKEALLEVVKDKATALIGTHTHVQTADEKIEDGCAFICDAGMCGPYDSILGRDRNEVLSKMMNRQFTRYQAANGEPILCGVVIEIDDLTNRAVHITRLQKRPRHDA